VVVLFQFVINSRGGTSQRNYKPLEKHDLQQAESDVKILDAYAMPSVATSCNDLNLRIDNRIPIGNEDLIGIMNGTLGFNDIRLQEAAKPLFSEENYSKFTIPELKERARLRHLTYRNDFKKPDFVAILVTADQILLQQIQEHHQQNQQQQLLQQPPPPQQQQQQQEEEVLMQIDDEQG
jgi:hypothetical protein